MLNVGIANAATLYILTLRLYIQHLIGFAKLNDGKSAKPDPEVLIGLALHLLPMHSSLSPCGVIGRQRQMAAVGSLATSGISPVRKNVESFL